MLCATKTKVKVKNVRSQQCTRLSVYHWPVWASARVRVRVNVECSRCVSVCRVSYQCGCIWSGTTVAASQDLRCAIANPHNFFFLTSTVGEKNQNKEKEEVVLSVRISELMERERDGDGSKMLETNSERAAELKADFDI